MKKYISLLRGINVSGQKKILMADLKFLYEGVGFNDVITYIQSGNVVFSSSLKSEVKLKEILEQAIEKKYKFHVPVLVTSLGDFKGILEGLPFKSIDPIKDATKFLITFLSNEPTKADVASLQECVNKPERLEVVDRSVYLHCPNGYGRSKLSNAFIERKLKLSATTRSLKTVQKLYDLIGC